MSVLRFNTAPLHFLVLLTVLIVAIPSYAFLVSRKRYRVSHIKYICIPTDSKVFIFFAEINQILLTFFLNSHSLNFHVSSSTLSKNWDVSNIKSTWTQLIIVSDNCSTCWKFALLILKIKLQQTFPPDLLKWGINYLHFY